MASNRAANGFWEMVRDQYSASQVIWECKNYEELKAEDFHQSLYYMSDSGGRFVVIVFRGDDIKESYCDHIRRVSAERKGLVLLLTEKDIRVFLRQAINGKSKEDHIYAVYDKIVRAIS